MFFFNIYFRPYEHLCVTSFFIIFDISWDTWLRMVHGRSLQHHQRHLGPWRIATHTNRDGGQCAGVTGQRINASKKTWSNVPEASPLSWRTSFGSGRSFFPGKVLCWVDDSAQPLLDSLHFAIATGEAEGLVDLEYDRSLRVRISGGIEIDLQKMSIIRFCPGCILSGRIYWIIWMGWSKVSVTIRFNSCGGRVNVIRT